MSPFIRKLKEMQSTKPIHRKVSVSSDKKIVIDSFEFSHEVWSNLIPSIVRATRVYLLELLDSEILDQLLDTTLAITVQNINSPDFVIMLGSQVFNCLILECTEERLHFLLHALTSYVELSYHGCGGGAMRYEEVLCLNLRHLKWHRDTIYYYSETKKIFSIKCHAVRRVERKLPASLARIYLIYVSILRVLEMDSAGLVVKKTRKKGT
jgi:hypothetical protein